MEPEWKKSRKILKDGVENCAAFLKDAPLSRSEKGALMTACVKNWLAMPLEKRLEIQAQCANYPQDAKSCKGFKTLNPDVPLTIFIQNEVKQFAECEAGKLQAPDQKTKQEFAAWCLAQIQPSINKFDIAVEPIDSTGVLPKSDTKTALILSLLLKSAKRKVPYTIDEVAELTGSTRAYIKNVLQRIRRGLYEGISITDVKLSAGAETHEIESKTDAGTPIGDVLPFPVELYSVKLIPIVEGEIYIYDHYLNLNYNQILEENEVSYDVILKRQLKLFPKVILILLKNGEKGVNRNTIVLIDPIGQSHPVARPYVHNLFKLDFIFILKTLIYDAWSVNWDDIWLTDFDIKICISHIHSDHWTGISLLISQLQEEVQYPVEDIEVFVPDNTKSLLEEYNERVIGAENIFLASKLGWNLNFVKKIREKCDLFYGKFAEFAEISHKIRVIPIPFQKKFDEEFRLESTEIMHEGAELLFRYKGLGGEYIFLDDLFPPFFALGTTLPPKASYRSIKKFYTTLQPTDICLWSHIYPSIKHETMLGRFVLEHDAELRFWINSNITIPYFKARKAQKGKSRDLIFQELFREIVNNRDILSLMIKKFFKMDETQEKYEERDRICQIIQILINGATKTDAIIGYICNPYPGKRFKIPESIKSSPKYEVIDGISMAWSGFNFFDIDPLGCNPPEFQSAVLVIGFLVNILQYSEEWYTRTRGRLK